MRCMTILEVHIVKGWVQICICVIWLSCCRHLWLWCQWCNHVIKVKGSRWLVLHNCPCVVVSILCMVRRPCVWCICVTSRSPLFPPYKLAKHIKPRIDSLSVLKLAVHKNQSSKFSWTVSVTSPTRIPSGAFDEQEKGQVVQCLSCKHISHEVRPEVRWWAHWGEVEEEWEV